MALLDTIFLRPAFPLRAAALPGSKTPLPQSTSYCSVLHVPSAVSSPSFLSAGCRAVLCPPFPRLSLRWGASILASGPSCALPWHRWAALHCPMQQHHSAPLPTPCYLQPIQSYVQHRYCLNNHNSLCCVTRETFQETSPLPYSVFPVYVHHVVGLNTCFYR